MRSHITIIIVNYNVRHFIKRCIESIQKSVTNFDYEIVVVDNASIDGSVAMLRSEFPNVKLIANEENVGFGKANNQAIAAGESPYTLILNPDTVIQEDTLQICVDYMEKHQQVGALGVKMIDGAGKFLPESKRSLPSIWNSLFKLSGLASIFPKSKLFNGYALGHLSEDETHEVEVLCGAFMFVRKEVIDKVGPFDERFFMYGEDIDWSKRIIEGGYKIHYLGDTTIIHYKGESTKKASLSYVKTFYGAMSLYVEKHYSGAFGRWFSWFLKAGISFRAAVSGFKRLIGQITHPLVDGILIVGALYFFSQWWESYYFENAQYYESKILKTSIGIYALTWAFVLWFVGYYKKPSIRKRLVGGLAGLLLILAGYALLPEDMRTSRVLILAGAGITFLISMITALFSIHKDSTNKPKNILIVATKENGTSIKQSLKSASIKSTVLGLVNPNSTSDNELDYLNNIDQLGPLSKVLKADEIIFSSEDMSMKEIMKQMVQLETRLSFKIAGDDSLSILGSNSKNTTGELYSINIKYNLEEEYYNHVKRVFDVVSSLVLFLLSPIVIFINGFKPLRFLKHIFSVFFGMKTWVGYAGERDDYQNLPELREGVIKIAAVGDTQRENSYYARDYSVWNDLETLVKRVREI